MKKILAVMTTIMSIGAMGIVVSAESEVNDGVEIEEPNGEEPNGEDLLGGDPLTGDVSIDLTGGDADIEESDDLDGLEILNPEGDGSGETSEPDILPEGDGTDILDLLNPNGDNDAGLPVENDTPVTNVIPDVTPVSVTPTPVVVNPTTNTNATPVQPVTSTPKTGDAAPIGASLAAVLTAVGGIVVKKKI